MSRGLAVGDRIEVIRERVTAMRLSNSYAKRAGARGKIINFASIGLATNRNLAHIVFDGENTDVAMNVWYLRKLDVVEQLAELA